MKIAIVILNWNGKKLLQQFLPSVIKYSQDAEIYLADNASDDDSVSFIKTKFPSVKIIINKENGGYAKGYNDALNQVNSDVFCLLNNDVEVTENWLKPIINAFESNKETAIIQPKILDYNKKDYFEYAGAAGGFIDKYCYPYCRGRIFNTIERDNGQFDDNAEIFWASGACLFIKSDLFKKLNGFDVNFFAHIEEIDLCWRAKNLGYRIIYVGNSTIFHVGGATLNNLNPKKTFLNFRNSLFATTKNAKGFLPRILLTRLILDGVAGVKFLVEFKPKHAIAIIKAHYSFYCNLKRLLGQRKRITPKVKYYNRASIVMAYYLFCIKKFKDL